MLVAAGLPAGAAAAPDSTATWQFEGYGLFYGEQSRAKVFEPVARITRLLPGGQALSAQFGLDAITGASPTGALPSGRIQTTTTASGNTQTTTADQVPTSAFNDLRAALDLEWVKPLGSLFTATTGTHLSHEKDYQSLGVNEQVSVDLMHRLFTLSAGAGYNWDSVSPVGGTPVGLTDGTELTGAASNPKRVASGMLGLSRVLTRRWMIGVNGSRTREQGYLTEPYKVLSVVDPVSGYPVGQVTEQRPATRDRKSVLGSSVYHLDRSLLYLSYRYYWDDWAVRSHTVDLKWRRDFAGRDYLQPHVRFYTQSRATFFRSGLTEGEPLPAYASSDSRLGPLRTMTLGLTYGFHVPKYPGEFDVRAEYMLQWGEGHPADAVGVQQQYDLMPPVNTGSLVIGYTVGV
jgi:hypothetical protein